MTGSVAVKKLSENSENGGLAKSLRGSNWIHNALGLVEVDSCGFGVIALSDIKKDTLLIMYGGSVITEQEFDELPEELQHYPFQISDELFLSPTGADDIGIGERVNHSCSPNAGFSGAIALVALRDIAQGESVTIDYATCVASDDDAFQMDCKCDAPNCRRVITGNDWKIKDVQDRLLPFFQPFLQAKVQQVSAGIISGPGSKASACLNGRAQNDDTLRGSSSKDLSSARRLTRVVSDFFREALRQEWMAVPICVIAGIPSTIVTIGIMALLGSLMKSVGLGDDQVAYVAYFSILSSVVGYITYLFFYYIGMLWKERSDFILRGKLNTFELYRKLRVVKYDFITHLPYDFWVMPLMSTATAGFFAFGASEWVSVLVVNTLADIAYAIKEPFFWSGAKKLAAWEEKRQGM